MPSGFGGVQAATMARRLLQDSFSPGPDVPGGGDGRKTVIIVASIVCALLCVLGVGLLARCARRRHLAAAFPDEAAANRGVKRAVLDAIPTMAYDSAVESSKAEPLEECAICLARFQDGEETRLLPQCGHSFHAACVDRWLRGHSSCPSCRRILVVKLPPGQRSARRDAPWKRLHYGEIGAARAAFLP